ncbi:MAG: hypothetical protein ACLRWQ_05075 [Flavonifractor plautii]
MSDSLLGKSDRRDFFCDLMMLPDGTPIIPVDMLDWLARKGFFRSPASTRFHGATEGGLYRHPASVMRFLRPAHEGQFGLPSRQPEDLIPGAVCSMILQD